MSTLDRMLQGLTASAGWGQGAIAFNEQGVASFDVDGQLVMQLERVRDDRALQLYAGVGLVPAMHREALYRQALEANLFGGETRDSVLSIDPDSNELMLSQLVQPSVVSDHDFVALLDDFIEVALRWQERLKAIRWQLPTSDTRDESTPSSASSLHLNPPFI
ncbi:type III secretion system chaperone [Diaphorobacter caeni]|uniref:type III secretion system chaperone n=1 Tax=Diaphorobacter caeni TaxID=2784387 RepID=UPI0018900F06|nr:type III secretion system chaperone [Diaphorobacter caeni]MBF5005831.1 type III secretion system chaperone [Diaphorobacter caeni]